MRAAAAVMVLAGALALTGCSGSSTTARGDSPAASPSPASPSADTTTATTPAPQPAGPSPTATPVASPAPGVLPKPPAHFTADALTAESKRVADRIQSLIDPGLIVHVDDHSELVAKGDGTGHYFGILRTITLVPAADATHLAQSTAATLLASGWLSRDTSDQGAVYLTGLASSTDDASSWFLVIGGDDSTEGQSAFSFQMASPDVRP